MSDSPPTMPRWVKVFGIIALALVLLFVILTLTGNTPGGHGSGRHAPSGDAGDRTPSTGVTEPDGGGHTPPIEHGVQQP